MIGGLWIGAFALFLSEAPAGSIASATVLPSSNVEACSNLQPVLAEHPVLPDGERWEVDPRFGVDLEVEAITRFPTKAKKSASWAAVLSCRGRGAALDARPAKQWAVAIHKNTRGAIEIGDLVLAGDETSRVEAVVPFIADADADGTPELGLRGTILEERGAERIEGDADVFVFFKDKKRLVVRKRARKTIAKEDGTILRSGIAERAHAVGRTIVVETSVFAANDEAALDRWWEESSSDDVISNGSQRTITQSGDGELTIYEGEKKIAAVPFRGRIARLVRDRSHLYAAVYVAEQAETRELYLIDLTTERVRKLPRREGEEIAQWSWSADGSYAVYSASAGGPLFVCSMKELESWIATGAISTTEVRVPGAKGVRFAFVRWTSKETFELAAGAVHYRWDARNKRAVRLYEAPSD